jgi:tetratricopeptide (TPR) repeat protein
MRLSALIVAATVINVPATAHSQSDVDLKTTNQQAISEFKLGVRDFQYNSPEGAARHFEAALRADPNFGLARAYWAYFAQLPDSKRDAEIDRGIADAATRGTDNELILALVIREVVAGRYKVVAALSRAAAALRPGDRFAEFASTLDLGGSEALTAHRALAARHPEYAVTYNALAGDLWRAGDRTGALAAAKKQIELEPNASNAHDTYAHFLKLSGDFEAAKAHYVQAVKLPSPYPRSYAGLAQIAALHGNYDEARSYLNQAITASYTPLEKLGYMRQIAGTYALQNGQVDALVKQLESVASAAKAEGRNDLAAEVYGQIAATEATRGNADAAHRYIGMTKTIAKDAWWPHFYASVAHSQLKHWDPASSELSALESMAGSNPGVPPDLIAIAKGVMLTRQGKHAEALKVLMTADTTNFVVMNRVAEAHAALGHSADATMWNKRILDNYNVTLEDLREANARRRAREENARGNR